jgi:hypothetical protein
VLANVAGTAQPFAGRMPWRLSGKLLRTLQRRVKVWRRTMALRMVCGASAIDWHAAMGMKFLRHVLMVHCDSAGQLALLVRFVMDLEEHVADVMTAAVSRRCWCRSAAFAGSIWAANTGQHHHVDRVWTTLAACVGPPLKGWIISYWPRLPQPGMGVSGRAV